MELRCKVFHAADTAELEIAINRFLGDEPGGEIQFEEITQSEGPSGVTIVLWYSSGDNELDELEGPEELDDVRKELA